ncbi:MAG: hypothetical protein K0R46_1863 [Herbinix sp.]|nr:hypothetical protein [Herbinix sp.]
MSYYRTCPDCGAHLDPGEECSCGKEADAECTSEITTMILPVMSVKSIDLFVSTKEYLEMKQELTISFRG